LGQDRSTTARPAGAPSLQDVQDAGAAAPSRFNPGANAESYDNPETAAGRRLLMVKQVAGVVADQMARLFGYDAWEAVDQSLPAVLRARSAKLGELKYGEVPVRDEDGPVLWVDVSKGDFEGAVDACA
jgi:hypothetical protein